MNTTKTTNDDIYILVDLNKKLGCGTFAKVYYVEHASENEIEQQNFNIKHPQVFKLIKNKPGEILKKMVIKVGKISETESMISCLLESHDNIIEFYGINLPTIDINSKKLLCEKLQSNCQDECSKLVNGNLVDYLIQIFNGLNYLHTKFKLIFCDLSLNNTGIGYDNKFKLFDFGSSKIMNRKMQNPRDTNKLFCSPFFHSEIIEPEPIDDFFSLWYIYLRQIGIRLPWEYTQFYPGVPIDHCDNIFGMYKLNFFPQLSIDQKALWPFDLKHESFYCGIKWQVQQKK